jgi:hypothetical protein
MLTRPALRVLAPMLVVLTLLAVLLATRSTPTPATTPPSAPSTTLRPPTYIPMPAGFSTSTTTA